MRVCVEKGRREGWTALKVRVAYVLACLLACLVKNLSLPLSLSLSCRENAQFGSGGLFLRYMYVRK